MNLQKRKNSNVNIHKFDYREETAIKDASRARIKDITFDRSRFVPKIFIEGKDGATSAHQKLSSVDSFAEIQSADSGKKSGTISADSIDSFQGLSNNVEDGAPHRYRPSRARGLRGQPPQYKYSMENFMIDKRNPPNDTASEFSSNMFSHLSEHDLPARRESTYGMGRGSVYDYDPMTDTGVKYPLQRASARHDEDMMSDLEDSF
jgi:hypothetical protein